MIDWLTLEVPFLHDPIPTASVIKLSPEGVIEWETPARVAVVGSFESSVFVRSRGELNDAGQATILEISGNPAKFLQGHNIFGNAALLSVVPAFISSIAGKLGLPFSAFDRKRIASGNFVISRIDLTYSFKLATRSDVRSFIRALDYKARTRRGKGTLTGNTLYFGKNSRRWSFKFYCKGDELDSHSLPDDFEHSPILYDFADNLLRCELTLRSLELNKLNLRSGAAWKTSTAFTVWSDYFRRIDMNAQIAIPDDVSIALRPTYAATYHRWKDGVDIRAFMRSSQFYVHRAELLKYGIDICIPPDDVSGVSNVIPLIRVLEAKPVAVPEWARRLKLIHF